MIITLFKAYVVVSRISCCVNAALLAAIEWNPCGRLNRKTVPLPSLMTDIQTNVGVCNGRSLAPNRHAEADGKGDRTHLETAAETTFPEAAISECTLVPSWRGAKA